MNDNYLVLNGKRVELTEKQLKTLGIELRKNPFARSLKHHDYYCINASSMIDSVLELGDVTDENRYSAANYFNNKDFANQVALHQLLYRKLLKFAYDNECEDTAEWNDNNTHWTIRHDYSLNRFTSYVQTGCKAPDVYFSSEAATRRAIKEVVEPFVKEHPDFVW